ncbi:DUF2304 domain-containing protein [Eubacterium limosum]|uniref:DUF2304 domain-containing protein n=1 Tax=Eubacterium limosum TaxID=1736 RepID=UPI003717AC10
MSINLRIFLFIIILVYLLIIINLLRKKSLNLRYSLTWLASALVLMIIIAFPELIYKFSETVGIVTPANTVFVIEGIFVLLILLSLTTIVSHLNDHNRRLVQLIALLEKRIRDLEKNKE